MTKFFANLVNQQQLVMANYASGFNQSETGKHFELVLIVVMFLSKLLTLI